MKQTTLLERVSLHNPQSKKSEVTIKEKRELVEYWKVIHKDTNWDEFSYDLKHGKKSSKHILLKMVGTSEPKESCGVFVTEGCDNTLSHPKEMLYAQNKRLTCKSAKCSVCWDSWLVRESSRVTERIDKFRMLGERKGFRSTTPIHVIVSPPKWLRNLSWTELKKTFRKMVKRAGIIGGVCMFHACRLSSDKKTWFYSPHFHMIGFGWVVNTSKISSEEGWVIKNKGIRKTSAEVYSTVAYLLTHPAIAKGIHSVTWFGDLSYSAKYASELKREIEESEADRCPYCSQYLVLFNVNATDRPPPDKEWFGLFGECVARAVETHEELFERKFWLKNRHERELKLQVPYMDKECIRARDYADDLIRKLSSEPDDIFTTDTTTTDPATTDENSVSPTL